MSNLAGGSGKNMLFIGKPGSGKGSQVKRITHMLVPSLLDNIGHFSTGDMLRVAITAKTPMGLLAKSYMDKGELVPDDIVLAIVAEFAQSHPPYDLRFWDGFPRKDSQVDILLEFLLAQSWGLVDAVIELVVPDEILVPRISGRRSCNICGKLFHIFANPSEKGKCCDAPRCKGKLVQREDDQEAVISKRLLVYMEQTMPVLAAVLSKTSAVHIVVNGDQSLDLVTDDILRGILPLL